RLVDHPRDPHRLHRPRADHTDDHLDALEPGTRSSDKRAPAARYARGFPDGRPPPLAGANFYMEDVYFCAGDA
ncbi:MAG TPA: hypothetical protein VFE03_07335, partial [Caulobacteraceae bacterium]|nr:hypothetical protein [Caulobacteraceae bacterium]